MKVKFTNPNLFRKVDGNVVLDQDFKGQRVLFGEVVNFDATHGVLEIRIGGPGWVHVFMINPNSDPNFRFIENDECNQKFNLLFNDRIDKIEAADRVKYWK